MTDRQQKAREVARRALIAWKREDQPDKPQTALSGGSVDEERDRE